MYNNNNDEEYHLFLDKVKMHLENMSVEKKDEWIISQAKLVGNYQDFIDSLLGNKKIQYMPEISRIENFCKKVRCGEIYLDGCATFCKNRCLKAFTKKTLRSFEP